MEDGGRDKEVILEKREEGEGELKMKEGGRKRRVFS